MKPSNQTAGLILSAGASERMGFPKALIDQDGTTLLEKQAETLKAGGCAEVHVVIGADAEKIRARHPKAAVKWVENKDWQRGQFSSLQTGLVSILATNACGVVILPVDCAGVAPFTVAAIIETALRNPHLKAVVPEYKNEPGHPIYLSRMFCEYLVRLDPMQEEARLDLQIKGVREIISLPVNDPYVTVNMNTPGLSPPG